MSSAITKTARLKLSREAREQLQRYQGLLDPDLREHVRDVLDLDPDEQALTRLRRAKNALTALIDAEEAAQIAARRAVSRESSRGGGSR